MRDLAKQYAPVIYFDSGEHQLLCSVDFFLSKTRDIIDSKDNERVLATIEDLPDPRSELDWFGGQALTPEGVGSPVYVVVVEKADHQFDFGE